MCSTCQTLLLPAYIYIYRWIDRLYISQICSVLSVKWLFACSFYWLGVFSQWSDPFRCGPVNLASTFCIVWSIICCSQKKGLAQEKANLDPCALCGFTPFSQVDPARFREGGMSQLRCHHGRGFAGLYSLLFALLTVGLPGGMGFVIADKS